MRKRDTEKAVEFAEKLSNLNDLTFSGVAAAASGLELTDGVN